jgi:glycosyltransferase involved in cell wall biosynthesis
LLNSIFSQSFTDYEVVISDDSTTDEVMNYCKEIEDVRVIYLKHQSIHSATENWNFALKNATGKYRMLVHHDDYFSDHKILENIVEFQNKNGEKDAIFLGFVNENKLEK